MKKSNDIQSRRKQLKLRITIVILIFLLAAIGLGVHVVQNYIPSREHMSLTEYYGQPSDGEMVVVLGTDIMEERALKSGDQIYLPQTMVSTYLNQRYYWDSANQQILYATPSALENYPASESGDGDTRSFTTCQFINGSPPKKSTSRFLLDPEFAIRKSSAFLPTS